MDKKTKKKLLELIKANYNDIAESFDNSRKKPIWPELLDLAKEVKDGQRVIDVGCGNGRLLQVFQDRKIDYLGVDLSKNLIEKAKTNFPEHRFVEGDILDLGKIPEMDFDYVFCVAVLHHVPGFDLRLQALQQLKNKIKPEGQIVVSVWNLWTQAKFRKLIFRYFLLRFFKKNKMDFGDIIFEWKGEKKNQIVKNRYYHAFTKRELKKLAKKSNLTIRQLGKTKHNYYLVLERKKK